MQLVQKAKSWNYIFESQGSAQEAVYRLLSLPMKKLTRDVVFINTSPKSERVTVLELQASERSP